MRMFYRALPIALIAALTACGSPDSLTRQAQIDGHSVKMGQVPAMQSQVPAGLTPLGFSFTETFSGNMNGVSEADFQREAQRLGVSVEAVRMVAGPNAYLGADGRLRACSALAIRNGLCKGPRPLSIARRAEIAKTLIDESPCTWVGFNAAYNASASAQMGAVDYILNIAADCG